MNGSMRNNRLFFLSVICLFLVSCNIPKPQTEIRTATPALLWNFEEFSHIEEFGSAFHDQEQHTDRTPTPQLISAVDFDAMFQQSHRAEAPAASNVYESGEDSAQWLYFDPGDYSPQPIKALYVGFQNNGGNTWSDDYYLDFFSGNNPSDISKIRLGRSVPSGSNAVFEIPVNSGDPSWHSCWQLKNTNGESFYEFCYNHGNGTNLTGSRSVQSDPGSSGSGNSGSGNSDSGGVFYAFVKTNGSAPERYASDSMAAEFISTSPDNGHTFKAYDHNETLTVSFQNTGSETWDSSYALVFYSGYNWMHANSFSLSGTVDPGETAVFTLPMEIFEDNDKWLTCWYLSSPDGHNLSDFCFNYYTRS